MQVSTVTLVPKRRLPAEPQVYCARDVFAMLNVSYSQGMDQVRRGVFPLTPLRIGRRVMFRVADLHALLGIEESV